MCFQHVSFETGPRDYQYHQDDTFMSQPSQSQPRVDGLSVDTSCDFADILSYFEEWLGDSFVSKYYSTLKR